MKKIHRFTVWLLLSLAVLLLGFVFIPRSYNVPAFHPRPGTRYWNLPTGSRIGYKLISAKGNKKSTPIIYLHGGPGGPIYDENIKLLAPLAEDGYDVYLYDQIGCGHSARLENIKEYTALRHKEDLKAIVETTGAEKVIFIGQSWGAMLAALFVADNPGKVAKIIFTGPGPILPVRRELADLKAPDSLQLKQPLATNQQGNQKAANLRTKAMIQFARMFGQKLASDQEADEFATYLNGELNKSTVCDTSKAGKAAAGAGFYVQIMTVNSFGQVEDHRAVLRQCVMPVLVMKGQCDNQPWGYTQEYLELFPNARLEVITGAGHSIGREQPEVYLKIIRNFLNR